MIDKFYKNLQGLIYQYVSPKEVLLLERVCQKTRMGATQDYIWRYFCERLLEYNIKYFSDTWKQSFWRNSNANAHMAGDKFNYETCTIRHFNSHVVWLQSYQNFVFAADNDGVVGIFLVSESDLGNEDDTLQKYTLDTSGVECLRFLRELSRLVVVTSDARVLSLDIEQTGPESFDVKAQHEIHIDMQLGGLLYSTYLGNDNFLICNYPMIGKHFMVDQTISIYNAKSQSIAFQQKLELDEEDENIEMVQNQAQQPNILRSMLLARNRAFNLKRGVLNGNDRSALKLATYDGNRLVMMMFNRRLLALDTQLTKQELFFQKTNYFCREFQVDDIDITLTPMAAIFQMNGLLIVCLQGSTKLTVFDYGTIQHIQTVNLSMPLSYQAMCRFDVKNKSIWLSDIVGNQKGVLFKIGIDTINKKIITDAPVLQGHINQQLTQVNDQDMNNLVFAEGGQDGSIQLSKLSDLSAKPKFLPGGSKSIKSYKPHPQKEGLSLIRITQSKVVAALGNIIRVYSFDLKK